MTTLNEITLSLIHIQMCIRDRLDSDLRSDITLFTKINVFLTRQTRRVQINLVFISILCDISSQEIGLYTGNVGLFILLICSWIINLIEPSTNVYSRKEIGTNRQSICFRQQHIHFRECTENEYQNNINYSNYYPGCKAVVCETFHVGRC